MPVHSIYPTTFWIWRGQPFFDPWHAVVGFGLPACGGASRRALRPYDHTIGRYITLIRLRISVTSCTARWVFESTSKTPRGSRGDTWRTRW